MLWFLALQPLTPWRNALRTLFQPHTSLGKGQECPAGALASIGRMYHEQFVCEGSPLVVRGPQVVWKAILRSEFKAQGSSIEACHVCLSSTTTGRKECRTLKASRSWGKVPTVSRSQRRSTVTGQTPHYSDILNMPANIVPPTNIPDQSPDQ